MHTFFINTSKKELKGYDVLFDIHYENKTFVLMDCLMSDWYDKDKGYIACVKRMSDMIDGYVELNNAFNLIIYVDLPENKVYSSIPKDAFHDRERDECCCAMHVLFTHIISESIVQELVSSGRRPQSVLIMFGEEKQFTDFRAAQNDSHKLGVMKRVFEFIGIPASNIVERIAKEVDAGCAEDKVATFKDMIFDLCGEEIVPGIRDGYRDSLALWCDEIINEANVSKANDSLFERVCNINKVEADRIGVESISCPYDCFASQVNKSVFALSELNIAIYLLKCVEANSVFEGTSEDGKKSLIEFRSYTVQEIATILNAKKYVYSEKVMEIESLATSYSELKLAPKLSAFDYAKFGLDMYGDLATDIAINDVVTEENEDSEDATNIVRGNDKEVAIVQKQGRVLFSDDEFSPFDYNYEEGCKQMVKKHTTPEQYVEQAKKVRLHHLNYLKKLKLHVANVLSNYAGKSKENKPALLQVGGYRYAAPGDEEKVLEAVENVSEKAYDSMINQYMEFCAARSVAISDIEEQCNWFISRVYQIKESLKKIKIVAIGLLIAIVMLYIPFIVIQFESIFENMLTFITAVGSIVIPILVLYLIFAVITAVQKKKYNKAWKEFEEKSNQALYENRIAVQKYDQLLSVVIPALRWVYEYKLDVEYCAECCSVADAKIEHHRRKLRERISAIRNILGDLEYVELEKNEVLEEKADVTNSVDYTVAFCSGNKNCSFYSVFDKDFLKQSNN